MKLYQYPPAARLSDKVLRIGVHSDSIDLQDPYLGYKELTFEQVVDLRIVLNMDSKALECGQMFRTVPYSNKVEDLLWESLVRRDCQTRSIGPRGAKAFDRFTHVTHRSDNGVDYFDICVQSATVSPISVTLTADELYSAVILVGLPDEDNTFAQKFRAKYYQNDAVDELLLKIIR